MDNTARVGDKIRIKSISNASVLSGFSVGDVVEVMTNQYGEDDPHFRVEGGKTIGYLHKQEKYEIVERWSKIDVVELRNEITELREQFSMFKEYLEDILHIQSPTMPPPKQKTIKEEAREDVEEMKRMMKNYVDSSVGGNTTLRNRRTVVDFHVNARKGTVVALVKGIVSGGVLEKGFAKLAKGDVFDEDIGKAIALRRALGLKVLAEYTNQ